MSSQSHLVSRMQLKVNHYAQHLLGREVSPGIFQDHDEALLEVREVGAETNLTNGGGILFEAERSHSTRRLFRRKGCFGVLRGEKALEGKWE